MSDGSTEEVQQNTALFHCPHNIKTRVMSDVTTAMKTFRAERQLGIDIEYSGHEPHLHGV